MKADFHPREQPPARPGWYRTVTIWTEEVYNRQEWHRRWEDNAMWDGEKWDRNDFTHWFGEAK